jgi:endoglucanase
MRNLIGFTFIVLALGLLFFVFYKQSPATKVNRTFSPYSVLSSSWDRYKEQFIYEGRVLDHSQNDITTSEGQSYALLRAVWVDDKQAFDAVWEWTKTNLQGENNKLFGWRWGLRADGSYGFMENGGENSASDADTDIALALIFASKRWNDQRYLEEAKGVLADIWGYEVDNAQGKNYLVAGNWAMGGEKLVLNPSYFAPYAWRIFAEVDKDRNWLSLIDPAYEVLNRSGFERLDKEKGVGLPPDWLALDRKTGSMEAASIGNYKTDYSYDAIRTPFRVALDYKWFGEQRALDYLKNSYGILNDHYLQNGKLPSGFTHDGKIADPNENPSMYATSLGYFLLVNPDTAKRIYEEKITKLYSGDKDAFNAALPYYDQNWLWFGTAFYNNFLVDLSKGGRP